MANGPIDLEVARRTLRVESDTVAQLVQRVDESFAKAAQLLLQCQGKVIVTGMGKSGLIGRKIAATLSSTGTPSFFLHPAESSHGDLGVLSADDVVIAISYGGGSAELETIINYVARKGIPLIVCSGNRQSSLAQAATVYLDIQVEREACPLGLAPTASTTATLAIGDALAMTVMMARGLRKEDFAEFHPGGTLGRRLLSRVRDVMHKGQTVPLVSPDMQMKEVIGIMTRHDVRGVAGVVDAQGFLIGVITDGDLRRRLDQSQNPLTSKAEELMSRRPKTVDADELAERALFMMEQFSIQTLFAIEKVEVAGEVRSRPVGLLHLQDLLKAKVR